MLPSCYLTLHGHVNTSINNQLSNTFISRAKSRFSIICFIIDIVASISQWTKMAGLGCRLVATTILVATDEAYSLKNTSSLWSFLYNQTML